MMSRFVIFFILILAMRCGIATKSTTSTEDYREDLTVFRPPVIANEDSGVETKDKDDQIEIPQEPVWDITYKLDSLLDSISVNNQKQKYIQGYTIQVYTGSSRKVANNVISEVYGILPGKKPKITYDLPNYKVKVGKFYHRLEAQRDFAAIRKRYINAILVPQQFRIE